MFSFLDPRRKLTKGWQRPADLRLTLDLASAELNGVPLGSRVDAISFLGPVEKDRRATLFELTYNSLGIVVEVDADKDEINAYHIVFSDEQNQKIMPFSGVCRADSKEVFLSQLGEEAFVSQFGEYYHRDEDSDESILFYEFPQREWQVEFDPQSRLKRLIVTRFPVMADPAQRQSYGVTKDWPPLG